MATGKVAIPACPRGILLLQALFLPSAAFDVMTESPCLHGVFYSPFGIDLSPGFGNWGS